jgi:integrase
MAGKYVGKWDGGRIRKTRKGPVYVLEQTRDGQAYKFTLKAGSERDARAELALFNQDPGAYQAALRRVSMRGPVVLTADKLADFLAELKRKGRSRVYRANIRNYIAWWIEKLKGADLRHVELLGLNQILDAELAGRRHRIIALKSMCSWLRERGELARAQDPTLDLKVPQGAAAKLTREKLVNLKQLEAIYKHLDDQVVRDVLKLRINTGMHHAEVARIAAGEVEVKDLDDQGEIAGTIRFIHKSGKVHLISLNQDLLSTVRRLEACGGLPSNKTIDARLKAAAAAVGPNVKTPEQGAFRHTFITQARYAGRTVLPKTTGASMEHITGITGNSVATAEKFYDQVEVKPMVLIPVVLRHLQDPAPLQRQAARPG